MKDKIQEYLQSKMTFFCDCQVLKYTVHKSTIDVVYKDNRSNIHKVTVFKENLQ